MAGAELQCMEQGAIEVLRMRVVWLVFLELLLQMWLEIGSWAQRCLQVV